MQLRFACFGVGEWRHEFSALPAPHERLSISTRHETLCLHVIKAGVRKYSIGNGKHGQQLRTPDLGSTKRFSSDSSRNEDAHLTLVSRVLSSCFMCTKGGDHSHGQTSIKDMADIENSIIQICWEKTRKLGQETSLSFKTNT